MKFSSQDPDCLILLFRTQKITELKIRDFPARYCIRVDNCVGTWRWFCLYISHLDSEKCFFNFRNIFAHWKRGATGQKLSTWWTSFFFEPFVCRFLTSLWRTPHGLVSFTPIPSKHTFQYSCAPFQFEQVLCWMSYTFIFIFCWD